MATVIPVLGGENWLADPELIMNKLFVHMFLTDYSQSNIYQGSVTSLQYILAEYGDDVPKLTNAVTNAITKYYGNYFDGADVTFKLVDGDTGTSGKMSFNLQITAVMNGKTYDLNRTLQVDNTDGVKRFINAFK